MSPWLYAETPVLSAALLTAFGWWVRIQRTDNQRRDSALAKQSQALAVLIESIRPIREWQSRADARMGTQDARLDKHDTRLGTLSETTAVLAATLEQHTNWHETTTRHRVEIRDTIGG